MININIRLRDGKCILSGIQPEALLISQAITHFKVAETAALVHTIDSNEFHYYQDGMLLLCFTREGIYNNKNIVLVK
jgi:hypothetical protein